MGPKPLKSSKRADARYNGYLKFTATCSGDVRELLRDGQRLFCIYDSATVENKAHADICQNVHVKRGTDNRKRLMMEIALATQECLPGTAARPSNIANGPMSRRLVPRGVAESGFALPSASSRGLPCFRRTGGRDDSFEPGSQKRGGEPRQAVTRTQQGSNLVARADADSFGATISDQDSGRPQPACSSRRGAGCRWGKARRSLPVSTARFGSVGRAAS